MTYLMKMVIRPKHVAVTALDGNPEPESSLLHTVQTIPGIHSNSYLMGTGDSFPRVKRQGLESENCLPTSAEVKKMRIYIFTPPLLQVLVSK
jgi:hypothetical protein